LRLLLDTHALVWWLTDSPQLSTVVRQLIADPDNAVLSSAASAWEIATKFRLGKLPSMAPVVADIEAHVRAEGFQPLAVTMRHAQRAGSLPGPHKDPFDRMLIAQALEEACTLLSNELVFDQYAVPRAW
jgi:PIN domain nuclease of toxin-antitoxin system